MENSNSSVYVIQQECNKLIEYSKTSEYSNIKQLSTNLASSLKDLSDTFDSNPTDVTISQKKDSVESIALVLESYLSAYYGYRSEQVLLRRTLPEIYSSYKSILVRLSNDNDIDKFKVAACAEYGKKLLAIVINSKHIYFELSDKEQFDLKNIIQFVNDNKE